MKPKDVPEIIPFRPTPEDRPMIKRLIQRRKPKNMSALIRDGLKNLDEQDRAKTVTASSDASTSKPA
jgi:Arc/MetJ-type ribon-helix-helix transcriptional regulator